MPGRGREIYNILRSAPALPAGEHHSLLLAEGGALWACGGNREGQASPCYAPYYTLQKSPVLSLRPVHGSSCLLRAA